MRTNCLKFSWVVCRLPRSLLSQLTGQSSPTIGSPPVSGLRPGGKLTSSIQSAWMNSNCLVMSAW